jgi:hypothetical protein
LRARVSPRAVARFVGAADGCSPERMAEAEKFFSPLAGNQAVRQSLDRTADRVAACARLSARGKAPLGAYLRATAAR